MIGRCHDPRYDSFKWYGGRTLNPVTVCDRWRFGANGRTGFQCWLFDVGPPQKREEMDRPNNDDGYHPENFRWVSHRTNTTNTSRAILVSVRGAKMPAIDAAKLDGAQAYPTIRYRLSQGWPDAEAVFLPQHARRRSRPAMQPGA